MKRYRYGGLTYWFDPAKAPEGAVEVKAEKPKNKSRQATNKARKTATKSRKATKDDSTDPVGV